MVSPMLIALVGLLLSNVSGQIALDQSNAMSWHTRLILVKKPCASNARRLAKPGNINFPQEVNGGIRMANLSNRAPMAIKPIMGTLIIIIREAVIVIITKVGVILNDQIDQVSFYTNIYRVSILKIRKSIDS